MRVARPRAAFAAAALVVVSALPAFGAGGPVRDAWFVVGAAALLALLVGIAGALLAANARLRRTQKTLSGTVSELRDAEATASAAFRELESVYLAIPDILFTIDLAGNVVQWNAAAEEATGETLQGIRGRPATSFFTEEDRPVAAQAIRDAMEKGRAEMEGRLISRSRGPVPYLWKAVPLKDGHGKIVGVTGVGRDISDVRSAHEEQSKLAAIVENSSDLIGIATLDGRILYLNPAGRKLVGLDSPEDVRKTVLSQYVMPRHADQMRDILTGLFATGSWKGEARVRNFRTGEAIPIELNSFIIRDPRTGKPLFMANVSRDITEHKKMEEELLKAQKLESVGILAGGIAHDFNNLLTAILGNIGLAKALCGPGDRAFARLAEAERATLRARDLTQQLLTFSRGGMPVRKTCAIEGLVREAAAFGLRGARSRCEFSMPADLRPVDVDPGQVSQVIHNLVLNADQAMAGGGTVRVSGENVRLVPGEVAALPAGKYVRISVADGGVGIPPENMSKIFDPYFTTKPKGTGLGLATAYAIVRKHDGHIAAESRPGSGATFHVYLPAAEGAVPAAEARPEPLAQGSGKILLMDDEEMVRRVAEEMLRMLGYDVAVAEDGAAAVALYVEARQSGAPFDAVIMDLTVPGGMGGEEAVRLIREFDPDVKAVVSSGYSNAPVMSEYRRHGFAAIVTKPYSVTQLGEALRKVIPPPGAGPAA